MSRWSAEPLRIALVPGEIALSRAAKQQTHATDSAASILPVLDAALTGFDWQTQRVDVVLSQHFVRHVLTPPPGRALSLDEETALVRANLQDVYGDLAAGWRVRVHSQPPHLGVLGAAIDGDFARDLDTMLTRHGFRQIRIQPLAAVAVNRLPRHTAGWWVLAEPGWLSLFGGTPDGWQHVAGMPVDAAWHDTLADRLMHEGDGCIAAIPSSAWLHGVGLGQMAAPRDPGVRWQVLPHDSQTKGAAALLRV